ncbi:MAG: hypothetical protein FJW31_18715 [Acidobacteria bacterium]|nr:hypothetical protein [Acidobacteriota bacterium]
MNHRFVLSVAVAVLTPAFAFAQNPPVVPQITCDATAENLLFRSEGLSEKLGEIVLTCQSSSGAGTVSASISVSLSHSITNRLLGGDLIDARLEAQTVGGRLVVVPNGLLVSRNVVSFGAFDFVLPASGRTSFVITGLRVASLNAASEAPVNALLSTSGRTSIGVRNNPVTPGTPRRGVYASGTAARIVCTDSNLPATADETAFATLVANNVRFATTRVTEGFPSAFEPRRDPLTSGTRIVIRYAGFPSQARLFVPDHIAGSTANEPTSAGDLGWPASPGVYNSSPGGGRLLLARVNAADPNGAGGDPRIVFSAVLLGVSEVFLSAGEGSATYEVVDSNASAFETAQIPTFVALPRDSGQDGTVATSRVTMGPLSTVAEATSNAPVPRFRDAAPPLDCQLLRDCTAGYFPRLVVDAPALDFNTPATPGFYQKFLRVLNDNQGLMNWTARIEYRAGANWLRIFPESGINNASLNLTAFPERLAPGRYSAVLTIDAGPLAGTRVIDVTITVTGDTPPPAGTSPNIRLVSSYVSDQTLTIVPGSLASIRGTRLLGQDLGVLLDGFTAQVVSTSSAGGEQRVDFVVPTGLGSQARAQLQVAVTRVASLPAPVNLTVAAPVIFPNAVLNQDATPNGLGNPEAPGRLFTIYATGLPAEGLGQITAKLHDREITQPQYAGPAPGLPGIQQINLFIPDDLPTMQSEVLVCGVPAAAPQTRVCSRPATIHLRRNDE